MGALRLLVRIAALRAKIAHLRAIQRIQALARWWRWYDYQPADPILDTGAPWFHEGVRLDPELRVFPRDQRDSLDGDWWWMRYRGKWGSIYTRLAGTFGPDSPWAGTGHRGRWVDPAGWVASLHDDDPDQR